MQKYQLQVASNGAEEVPYNEQGYPIYTGKGSIHKLKGMSTPDHWHWDMECACVLSGSVSYTINQKTVTVHEGEGIFINSGQLHRNLTDGDYLCVLIHPSALQTPFPKSMADIQEFNNRHDVPFIHLQPQIPWQSALIHDINALHETIRSGVAANLFSILARAYSIMHTLLSNAPCKSNDAANAQGLNSIREMMGYIQLHYTEKLRVSDISRVGRVGISTCHTLFRQFLGTTPMKYLLDYRMEKAISLLDNTNASISEIADMTGFASPSYFAECFRTKYSIAPTAYRRRKALSAAAGKLE